MSKPTGVVVITVKDKVLSELAEELETVRRKFPEGFSGSHHRAFGVLYEEFDELKAEFWKRPTDRDRSMIRREAIQVAVTAILIAEELG